MEASRPHLSRFSGGSSGEGRSPGVNAGIGRPTTLRYPDADLGGVYQQWCDDGDNELWMGGVTQVWRSSTELSGPAVVTQHCAFATASLQDEEETVAVPALQHPSTGGLSGQQGFSPSPTTRCQHPMWVCSASHVDACGQSDHAVLWSEEATNAERAKAHNEDTQPNCLPSAVKNASLTGLEDAPRKSYVRSTVNSPTRGDAERDVNAGAPAHSENTACGGKEDCGCVPAGDTVLTKPHYRPGVTLAISTEAVPFSSNAKQQRDWLYEDESVAVERKTRGDMTPQGRPFVSRVQPAVTGSNTADTAAAAADAVVAQLARLSIQASPTQKRLAFEEEEEDEDVLEGSSTSPGSSNAPTRSATNAAAGESIATANCGRWGSAFRPLSAGRGRGAHAAHCGHAAANRWSSGGRVASLSGLQLLRSRKRCLEEMESSDTGASAPCTPVNSTARPTGTTNFVDDAGCSDADAVKRSVSQDGWKRQKREEQRYQRQQRLLPGEGNAEDLIPAPMRAGAAASVCSSASFRALQLNAGSQEVGPPPQPLLVHGDATNWSQLSSITYVTPASQSCSTGMMGILSYSSLSQREGCPDAGNNAPAACSQVLSPLPTNVTRRYPNMKH
ncbi:hypothetical protein ABB37_03841 [Leptomonas pyrrhocoris]|uniref:Uncharacterized protein n=1 Tax=Leptomonas pyrrhocoris TaxID=157538 RepID=A0A0N0DW91_LEPPY|nr:hypothetical protein ABB37_03841 [Leptomonas pyrrhocoris]KPA81484.1 hypothetical protein ABB37_03841 [Leptomonas pyrrhocoris]|eukprot:XP_015659923.1 hypothetical protein ABB37_03841 [Leptomonas pyrrhocoris]